MIKRKVFEARIARAAAPTHYSFARWRRWRWSITRYAVTDESLGMAQGRIHLWGDCGYTFTKLGAALAIANEIIERPSCDPGSD